MACEEFNFSRDNECTHVNIGCRFLYNITSKDADGNPEPITGQTFNFKIVDAEGSVLLELNNTITQYTTGFYINDDLLGDFDMYIAEAQSSLMAEGSYDYIFTRTLASGDKKLEGYGIIQFIDRGV